MSFPYLLPLFSARPADTFEYLRRLTASVDVRRWGFFFPFQCGEQRMHKTGKVDAPRSDEASRPTRGVASSALGYGSRAERYGLHGYSMSCAMLCRMYPKFERASSGQSPRPRLLHQWAAVSPCRDVPHPLFFPFPNAVMKVSGGASLPTGYNALRFHRAPFFILNLLAIALWPLGGRDGGREQFRHKYLFWSFLAPYTIRFFPARVNATSAGVQVIHPQLQTLVEVILPCKLDSAIVDE